jgi:cytochrome c oxidase cbb3-type subunit III
MAASDAAPRRYRPGWKAWIGAALVLALLAGGTFYYFDQAEMRARLMRADPDAAAGNAELRRFAISYAAPVYADNCAGCHGDRMQGDPRYGAPNLTDEDWLYGDGRTSQIEHTILFGIRASNGRTMNFADMPAFARPVPYARYKIEPLEPGDIRDVATFLLTAAGHPGDAAAATRGERIFADKGQCFDCHAVDAKGDTAIGAPNLVDKTWLYGNGSFEDITAIIATGRRGICPAWFERLSAVEIRALAVSIYAASHPAPPRTPAPVPSPAG